MILGSCKYWALGAVLAGLTVPALAETRADQAPQPLASAEVRAPQAPHSRRVELPLPLDVRAPEPAPRTLAPREAAPHPFRESELKRAALDSTVLGKYPVRLSQLSEFG